MYYSIPGIELPVISKRPKAKLAPIDELVKLVALVPLAPSVTSIA